MRAGGARPPPAVRSSSRPPLERALARDHRAAATRKQSEPVLQTVPDLPPSVTSAAPASTRFTEESVTVGAEKWALQGTLPIPVGPVAAAVVLVHGSGPNDRDETLGPNKPFRDLAWGLADRGIAVLRYEKRTRQYAGKMAGNPNLTVREETTDDAILAAALLRAHDRIDPKRVFVLGHSLGGTLAPRIAAEDRSLAGLIILAGATRPLMEGKSTPSEYDRAGHIPDLVLDDIADWIRKINNPKQIGSP